MDDARNIGEGAFIRAFAKHEPALRAYARALLPDWDAVDEALQEASVVMWRKIGQLQAEEEFLPWAKVQINSANFGVGVACTGGGNGAQAYVDFLELTVYYFPPGDENNRFKGGTCDGYDQMSYLQTSGTNSFPLILARFNGGTHDGYDLNSFTNTPVVVQAESGGTIFGFR